MTINRKELEERYNKAEGTVPVPISYTLNDLECILIGAWEGGSTYWVGKAEVNNPTIPDKKEAHALDWCTSEWAFHALLEGGTIYFEDNEGGEYNGTLTLEGLKKGLELFVANRAERNTVNFVDDGKLDAGQLDAGDSDVILQLGIFGEWVFG